jgi:hypothetical protein
VVNTGAVVNTGVKTFDLRGGSAWTAAATRYVLGVMRTVSVGGLLLTVATGLLGSQIPIANFDMTFFFVVFVLGFAYATILIGDVFQLINPWRTTCSWIERFAPGAFRGRYRYPQWLAYYPALLLYMAFIWIELFADILPSELSVVLLAYSVINLVGAYFFGKTEWFERGEFFSVYFRLIGKMAVLNYSWNGSDADGLRVELRKPFLGLLREPASDLSVLLFVLFMLSSTAVDGAHETLPWVGLFWKGIYPALASLGAATQNPDGFFLGAYYGWQWGMLFLSPLIYLLVYVGFIFIAKSVATSSKSMRELILQFALTLVPIAFVYNVTHYFTLFLGQGYQIGRLLSDPFNRGWDLFGTAAWASDPFILDASVVWHTQVALIVAGHIVSVYLAHIEALKVFQNSRKAVMSQVPMLVLMMVFTTMGLWILSLPISAGQVTDNAPVAVSGQSR